MFCVVAELLPSGARAQDGNETDPGVPQQAQQLEQNPNETQASDEQSVGEAQSRETLRWLIPPSGCLAQARADINGLSAMYRHFESHEGSFFAGASGMSALLSDDWFIVPQKELSDGRIVSHLLEQLADAKREPLGEQTVFESPTELFFEEVGTGTGFSRVITESAAYPDYQRRSWRRFRYTLKDGRVVYALARSENAPEPSDQILHYARLFASTATAKTPESESVFYFAGKPMRSGDRVVPFVESKRAQAPDALVLHPGDLMRTQLIYGDLCVAPLARLRPHAVSVNVTELAMGPSALGAFAHKHEVPFVAANLLKKDGTHVFPRRQLVTVGDLRVAIIGLVDPALLSSHASGRITPSVRKQWTITGPIDALTRTVREIRDEKLADLVVVFAASAKGDLTRRLRSAHNVDLVVAGETWQGLYSRTFRTEADAARATLRGRRPLDTVVLNEVAVTELELEVRAGEPTSLRRRDEPILFSAPRDPKLFMQRRAKEELWVGRLSDIVLPAAETVLAKAPKLEAMVWGDKVLHRDHFDEVLRDEPARWSDPLWMRLVTNSIREAREVDVVLMRNMERRSQTVGDLPSLFTTEWLDTPEPLLRVELSGAELKKVQSYLKRQAAGRVRPEAYVFASGIDTDQVSGRPLDESRTYRVLLGERVLDLAAFEGWVGSTVIAGTVADDLAAQLASWAGPSGAFDPANLPAVVDMLQPHAGRVTPRWEFRLDSLSVRVSQFSNTGDTAQYAGTRETRVTTPDNFAIASALDIALLYDDADIAWETRAKAAYQQVKLDDVEREPVDDLLVYTELRFNSISLDLANDAWPLVPFARFEYDTEFTAVDDPAGGKLPHQHLLREQAGFSLTSTTPFREFRLFVLAQQDVGSGPVADVGIGAELKLRLEVSIVVLTSESKARYLFEDSDDRAIDLGLVIQSDNRITTPLTEWLSIYAFADLFFVRGKVAGLKEIAGSTIIGVGLDAHAVLQL